MITASYYGMSEAARGELLEKLENYVASKHPGKSLHPSIVRILQNPESYNYFGHKFID
jgi:hypothetical protein